MFLVLWNYIRGYVIIYVTGFSVERFINLAANRGIFIWDVVPERNRVIMKASLKNIEKLKECGIKTGCRFEIDGEYGLPVFLKKCSKRKAYVGGVLSFAVVMYIMSSFIWTVKVVGAERINSEDIIESCKENGLAPGKLKYGLDLYELGKKLMLEYSDISWVALELEGTGVTVNIVETIPETQYVEREKPMDVIASSDGIIESIAVSAGSAVVKEGDEVKKGDLLISSAVPLRDGEEITGEKYVSASGEVKALKEYELEGISPLIYNEKVFTGKTKTDYSVNIGKNNINIVTPSDIEGYDVLSDDRMVFKIGDYTIPFGINKVVYGQSESVKKQRTEEEAEALARKQLEDKAEELVMETGGELRGLSAEVYKDGKSVTVKGKASVVIRIDEQKETDYIQREEVTE